MRGFMCGCLAWVLAVAGSAVAATFAVPADGPVAFRRDRLPLGVEQMRGLSSDLVLLASQMAGAGAHERRAVAQTLALALALHPANGAARALLKEWEDGSVGAQSGEQPPPQVVERLLPTLDWLASERAGEDGWALADCLCDLLRYWPLDDARLDKWRRDSEVGRWSGWVPGPEGYGDQPPEPEVAKVPDGPTDESDITDAPVVDFKLELRNGLIVTPMWCPAGLTAADGWEIGLAPLMVSATLEEGEPFQLKIARGASAVNLRSLESRLEQVLKHQHGPLPAGLVMTLTSEPFEKSLEARRDLSVSAPAAVLCSAVLTGRETVAVVIGSVGREGSFQPGHHFWQKFKAVAAGPAQRVVVPGNVQTYLDAMLTVGDPGFYLANEVMVAADYADLLERALASDGGAVAQAAEKFKVIQEYSKGQDLLGYLRNSHVVKRLEEVLALDPGHASARMLLVLGKGNQSPWLPREVLLDELSRMLGRTAKLRMIGYSDQLESDYVPQPAAALAAQLDKDLLGLESWVETTDKRWFDRARGVLQKLKDLERAQSMPTSYERRVAVVNASRELVDSCRSLTRELENELK